MIPMSFKEFLFWALCMMTPLTVGVIVTYFCLTAPARRQERARLFLDVLETALRFGQSPERAIVSISETRERSLSVHFHLLAARIEEGIPLHHALHLTPNLVPPGVNEALKIGASENTLPRMLNAARAMLVDVNSRLRGALDYVIALLVVLLPALLLFLPFMAIYIWPKFQQIMADMEVNPPAFTMFIFDHMIMVTLIPFLAAALIVFFSFFYVAGPRATLVRKIFGAVPDRLLLLLPWRRRRAQKDFTSVLGILLDSGVSEERAVELAGRSTANIIFERRARAAAGKLREGVSLPAALREIEPSEEFGWRWANALKAGKGFFAALRGWHESLEAKAFQQEQAAAQAISSLIVIGNGLLVGTLASAVVLILLAIIEQEALW